jgi:hypothetical protein
MKIALATLFLAASCYAAERIVADYNFDGHPDYATLRESNGKQHYWDVYLFDPATGKHVRHNQLSHLANPQPDVASKEVRCIYPGGHSGALFGREDYKWEGDHLVYVRSVAQTRLDLKDGKIHYIRITFTLGEDGKPTMQSAEAVTPGE